MYLRSGMAGHKRGAMACRWRAMTSLISWFHSGGMRLDAAFGELRISAWPWTRTGPVRPSKDTSGGLQEFVEVGLRELQFKPVQVFDGIAEMNHHQVALVADQRVHRGLVRARRTVPLLRLLPTARRLRRSPAPAPAATRRATRSSENGTSDEGRSHPPALTASASYRTSKDPLERGRLPLDDSLFIGSWQQRPARSFGDYAVKSASTFREEVPSSIGSQPRSPIQVAQRRTPGYRRFPPEPRPCSC